MEQVYILTFYPNPSPGACGGRTAAQELEGRVCGANTFSKASGRELDFFCVFPFLSVDGICVPGFFFCLDCVSARYARCFFARVRA